MKGADSACVQNATQGWDLTHPSGVGCYHAADYCKLNGGINKNNSFCRRLDKQIQLYVSPPRPLFFLVLLVCLISSLLLDAPPPIHKRAPAAR